MTAQRSFFETVKKACHCEPVRRLAWQSVSPSLLRGGITDSHTSDIGHWFRMTGNRFFAMLK